MCAHMDSYVMKCKYIPEKNKTNKQRTYMTYIIVVHVDFNIM